MSTIFAMNMEQPHVRGSASAPSLSVLAWLDTEGSRRPVPGWHSYAGASFVKIRIQVGKGFCCMSSFPVQSLAFASEAHPAKTVLSLSPPLPARPLISVCHKRAVSLRAGPSAPLRQARQASALSASESATGINTSR